MIPGNSLTLHPLSVWQRELARSIRTVPELFSLLDLPHELKPQAERAAQLFGLRLTQSFARRIKIRDANDPLLLQVLPLHLELEHAVGFNQDPVGDLDAMQTPGVIHKYKGRVLLVTTGACAIHCRYCFRRHFPYNESLAGADDWRSPIEYLQRNPDIHEVILSGGDPLTLSDRKLESLLIQLDQIPHLRTLRIHSRLPIVLPERIDDSFLTILNNSRLQKVLVIHTNHPNEIDDHVRNACQRLRSNDVRLFNQSVLLKNINDDAAILTELCTKLFEIGVQPYYLHCLDRVEGASHFEVDEVNATSLLHVLQENLPGYCVPRLVREQAGYGYKRPISAV